MATTTGFELILLQLCAPMSRGANHCAVRQLWHLVNAVEFCAQTVKSSRAHISLHGASAKLFWLPTYSCSSWHALACDAKSRAKTPTLLHFLYTDDPAYIELGEEKRELVRYIG